MKEFKINKAEEWKKYCYIQHDIVCNQKYADILPYSFHVGCVISQFEKFKHLLNGRISNERNQHSTSVSIQDIVLYACYGHDLIEDARITYNNIIEELENYNLGNYLAVKRVADIIYCVTDEKGKSRGERKNDKYYAELRTDKLAIFVKLCDIAANTLFSKLTGSSMYNKYKKEFPTLKEKLYVEEYKELFNYVENL